MRPQRCYSRQWLTRLELCIYIVDAGQHVQVFMQPQIEAQLSAGKAAVALEVEREGKSAARVDLVGRCEKYEILETVVIEICLGLKPAALVPERQVDAVAYLRFELWIAYLERESAVVRPVVIQLLDRRRSKPMRIVGNECTA